jgi:hypothetical protein
VMKTTTTTMVMITLKANPLMRTFVVRPASTLNALQRDASRIRGQA